MLFQNTFQNLIFWSNWSTLVQLILVELSFGRVVVWSSCLLVKLVSVDLSVVELSVVELTDYQSHLVYKLFSSCFKADMGTKTRKGKLNLLNLSNTEHLLLVIYI
jgi:hypothetical protein